MMILSVQIVLELGNSALGAVLGAEEDVTERVSGGPWRRGERATQPPPRLESSHVVRTWEKDEARNHMPMRLQYIEKALSCSKRAFDTQTLFSSLPRSPRR